MKKKLTELKSMDEFKEKLVKAPKPTIRSLKQEAGDWKSLSDSHQQMFVEYYKESVKRGKAFGLLLPAVDQQHIQDLLAELYDLRSFKERIVNIVNSLKDADFKNKEEFYKKIGISETENTRLKLASAISDVEVNYY